MSVSVGLDDDSVTGISRAWAKAAGEPLETRPEILGEIVAGDERRLVLRRGGGWPQRAGTDDLVERAIDGRDAGRRALHPQPLDEVLGRKRALCAEGFRGDRDALWSGRLSAGHEPVAKTCDRFVPRDVAARGHAAVASGVGSGGTDPAASTARTSSPLM